MVNGRAGTPLSGVLNGQRLTPLLARYPRVVWVSVPRRGGKWVLDQDKGVAAAGIGTQVLLRIPVHKFVSVHGMPQAADFMLDSKQHPPVSGRTLSWGRYWESLLSSGTRLRSGENRQAMCLWSTLCRKKIRRNARIVSPGQLYLLFLLSPQVYGAGEDCRRAIKRPPPIFPEVYISARSSRRARCRR